MSADSSVFLPQEVIRTKRDGGRLPDAVIQRFVQGITDGSVGDAQVAAFAMAVFFQGMDIGERVALTTAMSRSGSTMQWDRTHLHGPVVDKHSTGGVGDKVSLMLAPLVASCGAHVPMISGRGLGHTGGTFDKLESIPGYQTQPDNDLFHKVVAEVGCAIIGQTSGLAPADGRLYSIRDVTATVESIPLITASILSKKLAAGLDALVMNVTFGNGAFMTDLGRAEELARSIVDVAVGAGLRTNAVLTDMNQVLGHTAGNALEVRETIDWLTGASDDAAADGSGARARRRDVGARRPRSGPRVGNRSSRRRACRRQCRRTVPTDGRRRSAVPTISSTIPTHISARRRSRSESLPIEVATCRPSTRGPSDWPWSHSVAGGCASARPSITRVGLSEVVGIGEHVDQDRPIAIVHARSESEATIAGERRASSMCHRRRAATGHRRSWRRASPASEGRGTRMRGLVFPDRRAAGALLGKEVATRHFDRAVVLGLPRGGVPVAAEVAAAIGAPLDVIVVRKLGVPQQPELAMGAIGEDGVVVVNHDVRRSTRVDDAAVRRDRTSRASPARALARHDPSGTTPPRHRRPFRHHRRRRHRDRCHRPSRHRRRSRAWRGASRGRQHPSHPPMWSPPWVALADDVVCLESPHPFGSVGRWYRDFAAVNDAEVAELLAGAIHRDDC